MSKLNVIGLGYIGLPTALMFSANGIDVVGTDLNAGIVSKLNDGQVTFEEEGIEELFNRSRKMGIEFTTSYAKTNRYIITVPTPYIEETKKIDPKYVVNAVNRVLEVCEPNTILVIESTVSPGTIDKFVRPLIQERGFEIGEDIHLVHAPERIIPGNMIYELENNSRTIGADSKEKGEEVKSWYQRFCKGNIVVTDICIAEMTKVVENTFRDINIAFANELTKICRTAGMDVYEIIKIANMHPRVNILQPGPGVGGHCISVDPWFLVGDYPGLANIILAARKINDSMPEFVLERVYSIMKENGMNDITRVGLYGLTYKENVDDVRESPSLQLIKAMEKHLAEPLKTYDPYVKRNIVKNQYHDFDKFLNDVDLVVIMVSHNEIKECMRKLNGKVVLDTKNICNIDGFYKM